MSDTPMPSIVWSGEGYNCLERTSDGGGEFPDGYRLTPQGVRIVARWLRENAGSDVEDCTACGVIEEDYCPVHYGFAIGAEAAISAGIEGLKGVVR